MARIVGDEDVEQAFYHAGRAQEAASRADLWLQSVGQASNALDSSAAAAGGDLASVIAAFGHVMVGLAGVQAQAASASASTATVLAFSARANHQRQHSVEAKAEDKEEMSESYGYTLLGSVSTFFNAAAGYANIARASAGPKRIILQTVSTMSLSLSVASSVAILSINRTKRRRIPLRSIRVFVFFMYSASLVTNAVASCDDLLDAMGQILIGVLVTLAVLFMTTSY